MMSNTRTRILFPAAALALCALAIITYETVAVRGLFAPPTAVATIDISKVIDKLNEQAEWEIQISSLQAGIQEEAETRQSRLIERIQEVEKMEQGPEQDAAIDELELERRRLEEWARLKQMEVDRERSLMWQSIYRNIKAEAAKLAKSEGYELVLIDDSPGELIASRDANMPIEQQILTQIQARRVIYAANTIDITEKLVIRMNNARTTSP